jgi:hypothetical protein
LYACDNIRDAELRLDDSEENALFWPVHYDGFQEEQQKQPVFRGFSPHFVVTIQKMSLSQNARADPISTRAQRIKIRSISPISISGET